MLSAFSSHIISLIRLFLAVVLLVSGLLHAIQPYYFTFTLSSYQILPPGLLFPLAVTIASIQVALALTLFIDHERMFPIVFSLGLFVTYAFAQASVIYRGMNIDCGCFGFSGTKIDYWTLSVPVGLSLLCIVDLYLSAFQRKGREYINPENVPLGLSSELDGSH
ncbi:MauE/DoxX family redox-associated membrane protein [Gimesia panareensis]|uniref:MauE/DoxX family redox-associated membrane protein n=1 Tax=Gimesia panareensis TaxID=2527978 RepID=UPI00118D2F48|nr:MauE/DoxX family redox-associated membrane protein [Gimesia panareensis]QDU52149.1 Methylamine utilization protein MauE [Gimesia panareensis]